MKKTLTNIIFWILLFFAGFLGIYIGYITIKKFELAVIGLIGLANIYLIHLLFFPPKNFFNTIPPRIVSFEMAKYIFVLFLICLVGYWSLSYFIDFLFYIIG